MLGLPWGFLSRAKKMTDEKIVFDLAASGPQQTAALRRLYQEKGREFGRFFVAKGLSHADADDVLQETMLKVLKQAASFRGEGTVTAWLWQIARNALIDHQRQKMRNTEDTLDDTQWRDAEDVPGMHTIDPLQPAKAVDDCVTKGLAKFAKKEPDRAYALELVVEGVDGKEIADRLGRTETATRQYLTQSRKHIAPFIEHCLQFLAA